MIRVLIVGGGVADPVVAMALQRAGIEATVYEGHPPASQPADPPRPVAVAPARLTAMSWDTVGRGIDAVLQSDAGRAQKAVRIAELIRQAGGDRWVGLYEVTGREIAVLGWSGPGASAYPRFGVTQGLSGVAVAARRTVVVHDVTTDPRYWTTSAGTLAEIIVPVVDPGAGAVVGTLDVKGPQRDAFTEADRQALGRCAVAVTGLLA